MSSDDLIFGFVGQYRFLSNFWPVPHGVLFDHVRYSTVEHAYVAGKTLDSNLRQQVLNCSRPGDAKALGRSFILLPDWDDFKLFHMEALLREKFFQGTALSQKLINTGQSKIVENNTWGDTFWGRCRGVGKNYLGNILMEIRDDLQQNMKVK